MVVSVQVWSLNNRLTHLESNLLTSQSNLIGGLLVFLLLLY